MARALKVITPLACTLLLAVYPLLALFHHNQDAIELSVLWWPLFWCLIGPGVLYGVLLLFVRRPAKAGVLASLVVIGFFYCALSFESAPGWRFLTVWLIVIAAMLVVVALSTRDLLAITIILGAGAAAMTVWQVVGITAYQVKHSAPSATDSRLWPSALEKPVVAAGTQLPDIYVLMPDDYARGDILKQYFGFDNSAFLGELRKRGFVVADDMRSPYSYSEMNMAALLNLDYLSSFPKVLGTTSMDMRPVKRVLEDNRASRLLGSLGYEYVHIDSDEVTYAGRNPEISPVGSADSFMSLWLQRSLLRKFDGPLGFSNRANDARFRDSVHGAFDELAKVRQGDRPKFVVFHTLIPHDPYIFGSKGEPVTFPASADHTGRVGMQFYVRQLQYVSDTLLASVDSILAHSPTPPVIVIQADEGFEVDPEVVGEDASQDIRVKGLTAFLLPGGGPDRVPSKPTMVNDLRFVFNRYLGTHFPMLASVSYPELDLLYQFEEFEVQ